MDTPVKISENESGSVIVIVDNSGKILRGVGTTKNGKSNDGECCDVAVLIPKKPTQHLRTTQKKTFIKNPFGELVSTNNQPVVYRIEKITGELIEEKSIYLNKDEKVGINGENLATGSYKLVIIAGGKKAESLFEI